MCGCYFFINLKSKIMSLSIKNALQKAQQDKAFAEALTNEPQKFKDEYNLSDEQIQKLQGIKSHADGLTAGCYYSG